MNLNLPERSRLVLNQNAAAGRSFEAFLQVAAEVGVGKIELRNDLPGAGSGSADAVSARAALDRSSLGTLRAAVRYLSVPD